MKILMVCAEYAPLAKAGGLADAVAGLTATLVARGHDVRVLLPRYSHLGSACVGLASFRDSAGRFRYSVFPASRGGAVVYLLELCGPPAHNIYVGDEADAARFLQLSAAAVKLPEATGWRPDVLHCHDWPAALVPALAGSDEIAPTVLTIHNMGHQGAYAKRVLENNGYVDVTPLIDSSAPANRAVNYLRAGVLRAAAITTVSPTYAREICVAEGGMGLEQLLASRGDLVGIRNGVDYTIWSPELDPFLEEHFDADDLAPKRRLKQSLCRRLQLDADDDTPLIGVVSRLDPQKGIDLLIAALPRLLRDTSAALVLHGRGRRKFARRLEALARRHPHRLAFKEGYEEGLAHHIVAASDLMLMPSRYEPCGLMQLYALRYGTVPVVRATGGLADTIQHFDETTTRGTGSVFVDAHVDGLIEATRRALDWFEQRSKWLQVVRNAMNTDFSWEEPVEQYESTYLRVAHSHSRRDACSTRSRA